MAKISDREPGRRDGGYTRLFNNEDIGALFSQVHATSISAGTELEKMIFVSNVENLDDFLENIQEIQTNINVVTKKVLKNSNINISGNEPDGILFILSNRECKIIELKDGDTFDTKKVEGEIKTLEEVTNLLSRKIPFSVNYYLCGFNSTDKSVLKLGLKNRLEEDHLMTGRELCDILGLDYNNIVKQRQNDGNENLEYFIDSLLEIDIVKDNIIKKLNNDLIKI